MWPKLLHQRASTPTGAASRSFFLTCLGRVGFTSSTLLVFILVFISSRCWRTALSLGPSQVASLLGLRSAGSSPAPCSGAGGSTASPVERAAAQRQATSPSEEPQNSKHGDPALNIVLTVSPKE
ncbi:hypothetical protein EYF80_019507 [Liparis tanakae]|uniref:Uncharacterized protein n=1 Tax=Liparis tanakae TaxID=230148 RepID=A0A4Z2HZ89_9TELE|nr:hypothetical protein EYF80_019507 [Liparis tanakae]